MNTSNAMAQEMTWSPTATRFSLWSPSADSVKVNIYAEGLGGKPLQTIMLRKETTAEKWVGTLQGDYKGRFYTFQVKHKGTWLAENPGIDAKAVGVNGQRGAIIDMRETDPEGWAADRSPAFTGQKDAVIYEMHHRDFSIDPQSGIKNKGKFIALTEHGTHNADGLATGIDHLKELGITHVHLLPSYDYGSIDETTGNAYGGGGRVASTYNWGYDPVNYNTPEGSYSTDAYKPETRIREFKEMVMALHKAGIRVIMDVVYNHVFDLQRSSFERTVPGYFFRYNADGTPGNASGCGNETASETEKFREYMVESVAYWMREYHVDGFRFDLMGIHDIETMNLIRQRVLSIDPNAVIYGEGWAASSPLLPAEQLAMKANTARLGGIAAFGDEMRDGLRGGWSNNDEGAFIIGNGGNEESVKFGIVGAIAHPGVDFTKVNYSKEPWTNSPAQMISYVSCHDDMCLVDRLKATMPGWNDATRSYADREAELIRLDLLAQTAVFTSQGVPFILAGEEMLRNKKGVHNSYASPDSINAINWDNLRRYPEVFEYYRGLIGLRKHHPAFRLAKADAVREHLEFMASDHCLVAFRLKNLEGIDSWNDIIVALNANKEPRSIVLPQGHYYVACCNGVVNEEGIGMPIKGQATVDAQSALILYRK